MTTRYAIPKHLKQAPILADIWTNVHQKGMNQNILTLGLPRTGKTSVDLYLGEMLGINYKGERVFNPRKHMANNLLSLAEMISKYNKPGQVLMWEEGGVSGKGAAARDWQGIENKMIGNIFQIMGLQNQILLINLPLDFFLEKQIRSLVHSQFFTNHFNYTEKTINAKYRWNVFNYRLQRTEFRIPRFVIDGRIHEFRQNVDIPACSKQIRDIYEEIEKDYKPEWIKQFVELMRTAKEKREHKKIPISEAVNALSPYIENFWDDKRQRVVAPHLMAEAERQGIILSEDRVRAVAYEFKRLIADGKLSPKRVVKIEAGAIIS